MKSFWIPALVFGLAASLAHGATITTYDSASGYLGSSIVQSNPLVVENFDNDKPDFTTFDLVGGSARRSRFTVPSSQDGAFRGFADGAFHDQVDTLPLQTATIHLTNGNLMYGMGATFNLAPGGTDLMFLLHFADGRIQILPVILGLTDGGKDGPFFFGFTSDVAFTSVTIGASPLGFGYQNYTLDDLMISDPPVETSATPEPATFALAGTVLVALGLLRRRPKAAQQS